MPLAAVRFSNVSEYQSESNNLSKSLALGKRYGPAITGYALELVQSDHTLVDVIAVDDVYRRPIGRPWITLMIDIASRTVPGFHLTMLHPSAVSVGMAMRHAVLPKDP